MSERDDASDTFLAGRGDDQVLAADLSRLQQVRDRSTEKSFVEKAIGGVVEADKAMLRWTRNLPKNFGLGAYNAALSTLETATDAAEEHADAGTGVRAAVSRATNLPPAVLDAATWPTRKLVEEFSGAAHAFAADLNANNNLGDDITQSIAQFVIPFMGWQKAFGAMGATGTVVKAVAAEGATMASAYDPHEGRLADLVVMGREAEGKFGDAMRRVAPDNSLINSYLNYMTEREGEGEWEGRFKGAVDSLAGTATVAALFKAAAIGFKTGRAAIEKARAKALAEAAE